MNETFNTYTKFSIVCIDGVLIFSKPVYQHFKHFQTFYYIVRAKWLSDKNENVSNKRLDF